jgi:WD repeat-containing protein 48
MEAVAPWCTIDISSGSLTVILDAFNCFDAEMYADELALEEPVEFRDDQRSMLHLSTRPATASILTLATVNLGKWVLRYLFANLIDEEIKRDEAYRQKLNEQVDKRTRANPPTSIALPPPNVPGWDGSVDSATTPRANSSQVPMTPGLAIGLATPGLTHLRGVPEDATAPASPLDKRASQASRPSVEKEDYFSSAINPVGDASKPSQTPAATPAPAEPAATEVKPPSGENGKEKEKEKDKDKDKEKEKDLNGKSPSTPFGKKFRMGMSFGSKKLGRSSSTNTEKPAVVDEKAEESESSSNHEKEVDDSFLGVIQKMRNEYDKVLAESPDKFVETKVTPSLPNDTPVLKLPPGTKIILQEEASGGMANIYMGTVETVGHAKDVDFIEQRGPMWLGDVLLQNQLPFKEPVKTSFVLHPWKDTLPSIATADGNNRLNANRMLRVKKILAYVAERIEDQPEEHRPDALKPEEYLELYCNDQVSYLKTALFCGSV